MPCQSIYCPYVRNIHYCFSFSSQKLNPSEGTVIKKMYMGSEQWRKQGKKSCGKAGIFSILLWSKLHCITMKNTMCSNVPKIHNKICFSRVLLYKLTKRHTKPLHLNKWVFFIIYLFICFCGYHIFFKSLTKLQ